MQSPASPQARSAGNFRLPESTLPVSARQIAWIGAIAAMLVLGGTNPFYPLLRGSSELIAAIILLVTFARPSASGERMMRMDWIAISAPALCIAHLIPLPPGIWTAFPGREFAVTVDDAVFGAPLWRPLSLAPQATLDTLATLLPPLAAYAAVRRGSSGRIRSILIGVASAFAAAVLLAAVQRFSAGAEWAYPLEMADNAFPIGFFTNHNHLAIFAIAALGLTLALFAGQLAGHGRMDHAFTPALAMAVFALCGAIATVLLSGSRAGLTLLPLGLLAIGAALLLGLRLTAPRLVLGLVGAALVFTALGFVLYISGAGDIAALDRGRTLGSDRRFDFWPQAWDAALALSPAGSGLGTFDQVYPLFEERGTIGSTYINHAHNDYLELVFEGGLPALVLMMTGLAIIGVQMARRLSRIWRGSSALAEDVAALLGFAAFIVIALHSLVDYPARTGANAALLAIAVALMLRTTRVETAAEQPVKRVAPRGSID